MKNIILNDTVKEYIIYNIAGTSAFVICQLIYLFLLFKINVPYTISSIICTFVAAIISYFLNSYITFKNKYFALSNLIKIIFMEFFQSIPSFVILVVIVELFNIPEAVAPMIPPVIMTPIMFALSKSVLKSKNKSKIVEN